MNFCGIICEFNPFHNGHEFLIKSIKKQLNCDIVCLMSGNFVQRGEPAFESKYERAKNAITAGADMVCELPVIYAFSNAENFAYGAVKTLISLGATHLAFGVEQTTLDVLDKIAKLKFENKQKFQNLFKNEIENEISYNIALTNAIIKVFENDEEIKNVMQKPNNILAIEYLLAIKKLKANIIPIAINRSDNGYSSEIANNKFISASQIRNKIINNVPYKNFIPSYAKITKYYNEFNIEKFYNLVLFKLRQTQTKDLGKFYDYSEGIEYKIKKSATNFTSFDEILNDVSSARYRPARVKKLLIYPLFNITKQVVKVSTKTKSVAKLLAINKNKKYLLKNINKQKISLIVTNKNYEQLNKNQKQIIDIDLNASNIYNLTFGLNFNEDKKIGTLFV